MQSNSKRLFKYIGKQQRLITLGVIATLLMSLVELFTGALLKFLTDVVDKFSGSFAEGLDKTAKLPLKFNIKHPITGEKISLIKRTLKGSDEILDALIIISLVFIGLYFLLALFNYLRRVFMNAATQRILQNFKSDIYTKILKLPYSFFSKNNTGDVVSRITYDVTTLSEIIDLLIEVARAGIYILVFIPVMFSMSWQLSLVTILYFPLSVILIDFVTRKIKTVSKNITDNVGDYTGFLEEKINRFKLIKVFGKEANEAQTFNRLIEENYQHNLKLIRLKFALNPASDLLGMILLTLVYIYYSFKVTHGGTSLGDIVFFVYLVRTAYKPVKKVAQAWGQLHIALVSTNKIFHLIDEVEEDTGRHSGSIEEVNSIEFKAINFKYSGSKQAVLKQVNLVVKKGDKVALTGITGSGKTTLLHLIPRFFTPDSGELLINDKADIFTETLRQQVVYIGADSLLLNGTIRENIEYSGIEMRESQKQVFANLIGLTNTEELGRQVGKGGVELSDGQKQKVAFLRGIVSKPKILILDEVFSSIDKEDIETIFDMCKDVNIVFVVSRKQDVIRHATKVYHLDEGVLKS